MDQWMLGGNGASPLILRALAGLVLGTVVGSFLATAFIRWPREGSVVAGRSHCDGCERTLSWSELIPLLSFLLQRGRCRVCGARIDPSHFAIEAAAAAIGVTAFTFASGPLAWATAFFGWWLLLVAALDVEHHWLPDRLTLPLATSGLLVAAARIGPPLFDRALGAAAGFIVLATARVIYQRIRNREGMGGGDPKLFGALGAWLGWQALPWVLIGSGALGLLWILLARLRGEQLTSSDRLPLGTLMAVAAWPIWLLSV